jgi:hypothetical protein
LESRTLIKLIRKQIFTDIKKLKVKFLFVKPKRIYQIVLFVSLSYVPYLYQMYQIKILHLINIFRAYKFLYSMSKLKLTKWFF